MRSGRRDTVLYVRPVVIRIDKNVSYVFCVLFLNILIAKVLTSVLLVEIFNPFFSSFFRGSYCVLKTVRVVLNILLTLFLLPLDRRG